MKTLILSIFVALGFLCVLTVETAEGHGEWWGPSEVLSVDTRGCCSNCGSSTNVKKRKRYRWRYWVQYNNSGHWVYHWHYGFVRHCIGPGETGWDDNCYDWGDVCRDQWSGWCKEDNEDCRDDYPSGEYEERCDAGGCNYYEEVCDEELLPNKC